MICPSGNLSVLGWISSWAPWVFGHSLVEIPTGLDGHHINSHRPRYLPNGNPPFVQQVKTMARPGNQIWMG